MRIATLLSFVAGAVNVIGFISIGRLTTNVTGHFAFFVKDVFELKLYDGLIFFAFILAFFAGSFVSNTLVEMVSKSGERNVFMLPVALEILLLLSISIAGNFVYQIAPDALAVSLLFAMGLQNALVTRISNAIVRTTHLTGLFTDLGIEVSQLLFYKTADQRKSLLLTINLRLRIIFFFFTGGIAGGLLYSYLLFYALGIPALFLAAGLIYDYLKYRFLLWTKKNNRR